MTLRTSKIVVLLLVFMPVAGSQAQVEAPSCRADYAHREFIAGLQTATGHVCDAHDLPCWQGQMEKLEQRMQASPEDLNLVLAYHQLHEHWPGPERARRDKLRAQTAAALAASPDDEVLRFLHARALSAKEAFAGAERAAEHLPDSPWPHLDLAVYVNIAFERQDPTLSDPHLEAFLQRCPSPPAWTLMLGHIGLGSVDFWRRHLPEVRRHVLSMPPEERLAGLYHLWAIEGRALPLEDQEAARRRALEDVASFEAESHQLESHLAYWLRLRDAHRRAGDETGRQAASTAMAERFPCRAIAHGARQEQLDAENEGRFKALFSASRPGAPAATLSAAQLRELYDASAGLLDNECDDLHQDLRAAEARFMAATQLLAAGQRDGVALAADADRWLEIWRARERLVPSRTPAPYQRIARAFLDVDQPVLNTDAAGDVSLHRRALELLDRHADRLEYSRRQSLDHEFFAEAWAPRRALSRRLQDLDLTLDVLRAATAAGDLERAARSGEQADRMLEQLERPSAELPAERAMQEAMRLRLTWLDHQTQLARAKGTPMDAVGFLLRKEALAGTDEEPPPSLALWRQLGGSDAGWQALKDQQAPTPRALDGAEGWESLNRPMPDFDLQDVTGKRWTKADLAGRTLLVNVWAVWCGPCRVELPLIQRLHERFRDDSRLLVLTLNADREIGGVKPFLDGAGYDFPALLGEGYFNRHLSPAELVLPQTWLVDRHGVIRERQLGFEPSKAEQVEKELAERLLALASSNEAASKVSAKAGAAR